MLLPQSQPPGLPDPGAVGGELAESGCMRSAPALRKGRLLCHEIVRPLGGGGEGLIWGSSVLEKVLPMHYTLYLTWTSSSTPVSSKPAAAIYSICAAETKWWATVISAVFLVWLNFKVTDIKLQEIYWWSKDNLWYCSYFYNHLIKKP